MEMKCLKIIWLPCDLKAKVGRLARLNGMTSSELIRLSLEARLHEYETGRFPINASDKKQSIILTKKSD